MAAQISAIIYVFAALCLAFFLTRALATQYWHRRGMIVWFVSAVIVFLFVNQREFGLTLIAALLLFQTPRQTDQRLPYCLLILCAVPLFVRVAIPFPLINYLITANYLSLIGFIVLAPALLNSRAPSETNAQPAGWGTFFILAYVIATTFLMSRELPFTSVLRFGTEIFFGVFIIYFVILRYARSEIALEQAVNAIYVLTIVLACIALLSQIKHWNFYSMADVGTRIFKAGEVRYGIMRTTTTIVPVLLGFLEAVGVILLLRHKDITGHLPRFGRLIMVLLVMGCVVSMSRGAWLAGMVTLVGYILLKSRISSTLVTFIFICSSVVVAFSVFSSDGFSTDLDPFQSFDYRKELFRASWDQFLSAPFIGTPDYLQSGRFDKLYQGEGIVDVVSVYLGIALQFGLTGLFLYVAPYLIALRGILKLRGMAGDLSVENRTLISSLGAFLLGQITMMFTVSGVSLVYNYGAIFVALANAAVLTINLRLASQRKDQLRQ